MEVNNQTQQQQAQNMMNNIDISKTTQYECEKCESTLFQQAIEIRKLSALVSPTGQAAIIPMQVFVCHSCQTVLDPEKIK